MRSSRRHLTSWSALLVSGAALVTGCGGGADGDTAAEDTAVFCAVYAELATQPPLAGLDTQDLDGARALLDDLVVRIEAVTAPEDATSDWATYLSAFTGMQDALDADDLGTAGGQAAFSAAVRDLFSEDFMAAATRLDELSTTRCSS